MPAPFCIACCKEMNCLKTGYIFKDSTGKRYTTDLFFCSCGALSHNKIIGPLPNDDPRKPHYADDKYSEEFITHIRTRYPGFFEVFKAMYL